MTRQAEHRQAEHRPCSADDYHANRTHDSNSTLRVFDRSPAEYYHRFVTRRIPADPPSDAQRLGTAIHAAILEPEKVDSLLALIPNEVLASNGAKSGNKYREWAAEHVGQVCVKLKENDLLRWQIETVWANPACRDLLVSASVREHSIFWTTEGHQVRCRFDMADEIGAVIGDIKRTRQTEATFWRALRDYAYHRQAALYCDGFESLYGVKPEFHFLILCDDPPYECCVRTLPAAAIDVGRAENADTLVRLRECKAGNRKWITEGTDELRELTYPPYLFAPREDQPGGTNARQEL